MAAKKPSKRVVLCAFLAWFFSVPTYSQTNMDIGRLIRAARMDSLAALSMPHALYPRAAPSDPDLLKARVCLARATATSRFSEILGDAAQKTMSPEELQAAQLFFESPAGLKYGNLSLWQARSELGLTPDRPVPQFSKKEEDTVARFLKSPAGTKLSVSQLLAVPNTATLLYKVSAEIAGNCNKQHDK